MKKLWNAIKTWASVNSKAIAAAVGSLVTFVCVNITGHDLDPAAKATILLVVSFAITWLFPANKVKEPKVGPQA